MKSLVLAAMNLVSCFALAQGSLTVYGAPDSKEIAKFMYQSDIAFLRVVGEDGLIKIKCADADHPESKGNDLIFDMSQIQSVTLKTNIDKKFVEDWNEMKDCSATMDRLVHATAENPMHLSFTAPVSWWGSMIQVR